MPGAEPDIELRGVTRAYGERPALRGVTVAVGAGQTLAVFGPNGAGKSTLLRLLATLLRPHGGAARVLGHELPDQGWAVRGRVGLVAHSPMLYGDLSARENLTFNARLHGAPHERIDELLERVQMSARADEPLHTLSRGMVQRVAVCRAVLHDPELLLLDEPLSHLDPVAAALVEPLIGRGATRFADDGAPRTRVVASHDVAGGLAEADFVLGLRAGAQAIAAPPRDVDAGAVGALYA